VARAIDLAGFTNVLGSVAGDDTVLVVLEDATAARALKRRLDQIGGAARSSAK
jgi:arginine repressor